MKFFTFLYFAAVFGSALECPSPCGPDSFCLEEDGARFCLDCPPMDDPQFANMTIEDVCNNDAGAQAQDCIDTCTNVTSVPDSPCDTHYDCWASEFCLEEDGTKFCLECPPMHEPQFSGMTIQEVCEENAGAQAQDCIDACGSGDTASDDDCSQPCSDDMFCAGACLGCPPEELFGGNTLEEACNTFWPSISEAQTQSCVDTCPWGNVVSCVNNADCGDSEFCGRILLAELCGEFCGLGASTCLECPSMNDFAGMTVEQVCNANAGAHAQDCIDACESTAGTAGTALSFFIALVVAVFYKF